MMLISVAAKRYRAETGEWPTNAVEFSHTATEAANMFTPTNVASRQITDMQLRPLTNGSLFISYRSSLSSTNIVKLIVTTNGHMSVGGMLNGKAEPHR
jgi:hypothetical protein